MTRSIRTILADPGARALYREIKGRYRRGEWFAVYKQFCIAAVDNPSVTKEVVGCIAVLQTSLTKAFVDCVNFVVDVQGQLTVVLDVDRLARLGLGIGRGQPLKELEKALGDLIRALSPF